MPELGPYGSVRGALSNGRPYRNSYLPEILAVSDRVLVARLGRIVAEFDAATATEHKIMYAAIH